MRSAFLHQSHAMPNITPHFWESMRPLAAKRGDERPLAPGMALARTSAESSATDNSDHTIAG
jgi:hypothetical protein